MRWKNFTFGIVLIAASGDRVLNDKTILIGAGIAAGAVVALVVAKGGIKQAGAAVGAAAVDAVDGVIGGAVQGAGSIAGVPLTDAEKCRVAMSSGNYMDASLFCPASTFLKFVVNGGKPPQ